MDALRRKSKTFQQLDPNIQENFHLINSSNVILSSILKVRKRSNSIENFSAQNVKNKNNPEAYKAYVNQLKNVMDNQEGDDAQMDKKSLKIIKHILNLERSKWFHAYNFLTFNLDYYSRIYYPICFIFFIIYIFSTLANEKWVSIAVPIILAFILIGIASWNILSN